MSYQPSNGDRVRVVLEGKVTDAGIGWFDLGGTYIRQDDTYTLTVEKLEDPEPPVGSVVMDGDGDVWHHQTNGWLGARIANDYDDFLGWPRINTYGPVKVLYTPESK